MRKLLLPLVLLVIIAFASCDTNTETNSPGFQSNIDSVFFRANDMVGSIPQSGNFILQGFTSEETITLNTSGSELSGYELGGSSASFAIYEDENGRVYSTNPNGSGVIRLTDSDMTEGWYSGRFKFTALSAFGDTVTINKGVFYKAPIDGLIEDVGDGTLEGFSATVDGTPFIPIGVSSGASTSFITISGSTTSNSIIIRVPIDVAVGNYSLPANGFLASYSEGAVTSNATAGNISVITHDTTAKTISGSFSFNTDGQVIQGGQFNVSY